MKYKTKFYSMVACILFSSHAATIELSKHLSTIIEPEPIERIHPKYPVKAAKEGRSGWGRYSLVIEKDGSVSNVIELASSGSKDFSKASIKAIKQWKYTPALENGEPVQQCVNTVQMNFKMKNGKGGVRKKFGRKYKRAVEALEGKDYATLEKLIEDMKAFEYRHVAENNFLHAISASYAKALNDKQKQFTHLSNIKHLDEDKASKAYKLSVLNERFLLAVNLNLFQAAFDIYENLKKLPSAAKHIDKYQKIVGQIDEFIGGSDQLVIQGDIQQSPYWHYSLVRNEFSLTDISGSLHKLDVRCANKRHIYTIESDSTWKVPASWKNCSLFVYGDDDTRFKLVEHPIKS